MVLLSNFTITSKRRLISGAFFVSAFFLSFVLQAQCLPSDRSPDSSRLEKIVVQSVLDGDTLRLSGGDVRLASVNTPEMNYGNNRSPEPVAEEATRYVTRLVSDGSLFLDVVGVDKYQRRLGNVWVVNKENGNKLLLSEMLIVNGLGFQIFESDSQYVGCLKKAEQKARKHNLGVWKHLNYWLNVKRGGFALWSGALTKTSKSKRYLWWSLSDSQVVRVPRAWDGSVDGLKRQKGDVVDVRGWVVHRKQSRYEPYMMLIKSPQIFLKN